MLCAVSVSRLLRWNSFFVTRSVPRGIPARAFGLGFPEAMPGADNKSARAVRIMPCMERAPSRRLQGLCARAPSVEEGAERHFVFARKAPFLDCPDRSMRQNEPSNRPWTRSIAQVRMPRKSAVPWHSSLTAMRQKETLFNHPTHLRGANLNVSDCIDGASLIRVRHSTSR